MLILPHMFVKAGSNSYSQQQLDVAINFMKVTSEDTVHSILIRFIGSAFPLTSQGFFLNDMRSTKHKEILN